MRELYLDLGKCFADNFNGFTGKKQFLTAFQLHYTAAMYVFIELGSEFRQVVSKFRGMLDAGVKYRLENISL